MRVLLVLLGVVFGWNAVAGPSMGQWMGQIPLEPKVQDNTKDALKPPPPPVPTDGIDRRPKIKSMTPAAPVAEQPVEMVCWRADWCTNCHEMDDIVQRLWSEGWPIGWANFDKFRTIADGWQVKNLPTCITLHRGGPGIQRVEGVTSYEILLKMLRDAGAKQVQRAVPQQTFQQAAPSYQQTPWQMGQPMQFNSPTRSGPCPGGRCPGGRCPTPGGW